MIKLGRLSWLSNPSVKSGLVICNYDDQATVTVDIKLDSGEALNRYRLVDDSNWQPVESGIIIPAQSAVVVI
jgi:hypothetical protein